VAFCPGGLFPCGLLSGVGIFSGLMSGGLLSVNHLEVVPSSEDEPTWYLGEGRNLSVWSRAEPRPKTAFGAYRV